MPDYIPSSDSDYTAWLDNFVSYTSANRDDLALDEADLAPLLTSHPTWKTAVSDLQAAQIALEVANQAKDTQRQTTETHARALVRILQAQPNLTDTQRAALGITIRASRSTIGAPTTGPIPRLEQSGRLRHTLHFVDETTPNRRAKPKGVRGCQIWVYVGETPPPDPTEYQYLSTDTRTPYLCEFEPEEGGELAHYFLRWVNSKDEPGPWSDPINASILP